MYKARVMQAKEPDRVPFNWSEKTMKSSQGSAYVRLHVKITGQKTEFQQELLTN